MIQEWKLACKKTQRDRKRPIQLQMRWGRV